MSNRPHIVRGHAAAMNLAGIPPSPSPATTNPRRTPADTEGQVGEAWRKRPVTSQDRPQRTPPPAALAQRLLPLHRDARPGPAPMQAPTQRTAQLLIASLLGFRCTRGVPAVGRDGRQAGKTQGSGRPR